jgi:hypothetical protein
VKRSLWLIFWLSLAGLFASQAAALPPSFTFFEGTQFPLTAYFIRGERSGPTVMVQGGIQGDEVSGYVSAHLLTRARVIRGNLLVVPRANVPSIHARKRLINVDLNRRFDRDYNSFYEDRLARVLRFLLSGCDAFIHLHEGSGFYHPTWVDSWRNPRRWGQSVIIDARYTDDGLPLEHTVSSVLGSLNPAIVPADYRFRLFNTDTFAKDTAYPDQRKSLTYYAMDALRIPALAIEVSKNIDRLGWKVINQLKATELFLMSFGVEVDMPYVTEEEIEDKVFGGAGILLNGKPLAEAAQQGISASHGACLTAAADGSGGGPALAVFASDRPDLNIIDAPRLALAPIKSVTVKADGRTLVRVPVRWKEPNNRPSASGPPLLACWLNGDLEFVPSGATLEAVAGDRLVIEGVWGAGRTDVLNLKGYVSNPRSNDGQDAGHEIVLDEGNFIGRYLERPERGGGFLARIVRETPGTERVEFGLRVEPREVQALQLADAHGREVFVSWTPEGRELLPPGEYVLKGAWSNGREENLLATCGQKPLPWGSSLTLSPGETATLTLRQAMTFKPLGSMTLAAPNS